MSLPIATAWFAEWLVRLEGTICGCEVWGCGGENPAFATFSQVSDLQREWAAGTRTWFEIYLVRLEWDLVLVLIQLSSQEVIRPVCENLMVEKCMAGHGNPCLLWTALI